MADAGQVNAGAADKILETMMTRQGAPAGAMEIARELNLLAVTDTSAIDAWVEAAIAANPGPAQQVRTGDKKAKQALGFLMGAVMKISGGKAPPAMVKQLLDSKLGVKS